MIRTTSIAVAALLLVGTAAPVAAATRTVDESDVVSEPARTDIRRLTVTNDRPRLRAVITLGKVTRGHTRVYVVLSPSGGGTDRVVGTYTRHGKQKRLFQSFDDESATDLRCKGLRIKLKPRRSRVVVSLPQRCLGDDRGTLRVQALTEDRDGGDVDSTRAVRVRLD